MNTWKRKLKGKQWKGGENIENKSDLIGRQPRKNEFIIIILPFPYQYSKATSLILLVGYHLSLFSFIYMKF